MADLWRHCEIELRWTAKENFLQNSYQFKFPPQGFFIWCRMRWSYVDRRTNKVWKLFKFTE
jgi:hypothetical protein